MNTNNKLRINRAARNIIAAVALLASASAQALVIEATVAGSDAIWLAGRTDLVIPPAGVVWPGGMARHPVTPEMIQETRPQSFDVTGGDVVRVLDPAVGGVSFFNGFGGTIFGPEGNGVPGSSSITAFGGISGYLGTQGALVGLFLDDAIPLGPAPARLDFSLGGLGVDFLTLAPALGQVFFMGNGVTSGGVFQQFTAPTGATRFFIGITDAFGFNGVPGAFDDNDGAYRIRVGINEDPRNPVTGVPEPASLALVALALALVGAARSRVRRCGAPV